VDKALVSTILARYPHGSAFQRWHMRGRIRLCPYDALPARLTGADTVLDIGCGFGHLAWYLASARPGLRYFGCDIDERKIRLAEGSARGGRGPAFRAVDAAAEGALAGWPAAFGNIVILDVLYLLPWEAQARLLDWALARLSPEPGSALLIKSMEAPEGISGARALAEEWIMVHLLRRTRSSGTLRGARPASAYVDFARDRGWAAESADLGTWNPSYLVRMHRGPKGA
jgi:SAM-dependent methyltransferase